MTPYGQSCANCHETLPPALASERRAKSVVAGAFRTLNLTVADALYAYAVTGSALASPSALAALHLEVFARCIFHGKG